MPFADVLQNVGDAIAGVDRTGAYIKGEQARANYDSTRAQTESSMELAKQRRMQAERDELEKQAIERLQAMDPSVLTDPSAVNIGDLIAAKGGADYSAGMQGRLHGQEYNQREIVATPPGSNIGDDMVTEIQRQAAEDALAPGSAIAGRRPRAPGAPIIGQDEQGNPVYFQQSGEPLTTQTPTGPQPIRPAARPSAPARDPGPTSQQRNIEDLMGRGIDKETAVRVVYNEMADPEKAYQSIYLALRRNFTSDEEAAAEAARVVGELGAIDTPLFPPDEGEVPEGSRLIGHTRAGAEVYETPDGQRLVVE